MTDNAIELEKFKKELRAILLAAPKGLTIRQLVNDYGEITGGRVPYNRFGYSDIVEFLKSMPNVVYLRPYQSTFILTAVPDENTEHIHKMVLKQRPSNSGYSDPYRDARRMGGAHHRDYSNRVPLAPIYNAYARQAVRSAQREVFVPPRLRLVTASEKQRIKELANSYSEGIRLENFERAYNQHYGVNFNASNYGFPGVKECLMSIGEVVQLLPDRGTFTIFPAGMLRAYRPTEPINPVAIGWQSSKSVALPVKDTTFVPRAVVIPKPVTFDRTSPSPRPVTPKAIGSGRMSPSPMPIGFGRTSPAQRAVTPQPVGFDRTSPATRTVTPQPVGFDRTSPAQRPGYPRKDDSSDCNSNLKDTFRRVLALFPKGISLNKFAEEYEKIVKRPLVPSDYGFHTVMRLVEEMTDVFFMHRPSPSSDFLLFNSARPPSVEPPREKSPVREMSTESRSESLLYKNGIPIAKIKDSINKVLLAYPDGIRMEQFPEIYKANCNEDLPWQELGYKTLHDFFVSLSSFLHIVPCKSGTVLLVHESKVKNLLDSPIPDCPVEPVLPGTDFNYMTLDDEHLTSGKYFGVFVSQVNSPGEFWFQLRGMDTSEELENLMNELDFVYNSEEGSHYIIPEGYLKTGMACAAIYPDDAVNWHRGKLTKIVSPTSVEVSFVDYGSVCKVEKKHLRFLRKDMLALPAQAMKARLSNLKPINHVWTIEARDKFLSMIYTKPILAKVTSSTYKNTLSLLLIDTDNQNQGDIQINKVLQCHYLAQLSDDDMELPHVYSPFETARPSSSMTMTELSYQHQLEYMQHLNMNFQYMLGLQTGMNMSTLSPNSDDRGIDMKVVGIMAERRLQEQNKALQPCSVQVADNDVYRSSSSSANSPNSLAGSIGSDAADEREAEEPLVLDVVRNVCDDLEQKQFQYCQVVTINDYDVHLINYKRKPYMTSGDISRVIWGIDVLKKLVKVRALKDDSITLCKDEAEELFRDLERNEVALSKDGISVILFPLGSIKEIVTVFHKNKNVVLPDLEKLVETFNPNDSYWTTEMKVSPDEPNSELEKQIHDLKQKRLKLLMSMVQMQPGDVRSVSELQETENLIGRLERKLAGEEPETNVPNLNMDQKLLLPQAIATQNPAPTPYSGFPINRLVQSVRPTVNQSAVFVPNVAQPMPLVMPSLQYNPLTGIYYYPMQQSGFMAPNPLGNPTRFPLNYSSWSSNN